MAWGDCSFRANYFLLGGLLSHICRKKTGSQEVTRFICIYIHSDFRNWGMFKGDNCCFETRWAGKGLTVSLFVVVFFRHISLVKSVKFCIMLNSLYSAMPGQSRKVNPDLFLMSQ